MKLSFYQLFLFLFIIINKIQCQANSEEYIYQQLYNATVQTILSVLPPLCSEILLNVNNIQSQYVSPSGLSGRMLPLGTFATQVLALEYLYGLNCPLPNLPQPKYIAQTFDVVLVTYNENYLITQTEFILNLTGNVPLTIFAGMAFDQNYKLCGYEGQVRNPGLTFDTYTEAEHLAEIEELCVAAQMFCNGSLQQYDSVQQCIQFLTTNVTYGTYDRADQGNVVCRLVHIKLVPIYPSIHCPHVGPTGGSACYDKTIEFYYNQTNFLGCAYKYNESNGIIWTFDLELWYIRSIKFAVALKPVGPKLFMLKNMLRDLAAFVYMIFIAIAAYGVVSRPWIFYNQIPFTRSSILKHIFDEPYWFIYGEVSDKYLLDEKIQNETESVVAEAAATHILLAFHMLFINILILNLLIAVFTHTINKVKENAEFYCRYQRYSLVREYFERPPVAYPPLVIFPHIVLVILALQRTSCAKLRRNQVKKYTDHASKMENGTRIFKMIPVNVTKQNERWDAFENAATLSYARLIVAENKKKVVLATDDIHSKSTMNTIESDVIQSIFDQQQMIVNLNKEIFTMKSVLNDNQKNITEIHTRISDVRITSSTFLMGSYSRGILQIDNGANVSFSENYIATNNSMPLISLCNSRNISANNNTVVNKETKIDEYYTYDTTNPCNRSLTSLINLPPSAFNSSFPPPVIPTNTAKFTDYEKRTKSVNDKHILKNITATIVT